MIWDTTNPDDGTTTTETEAESGFQLGHGVIGAVVVVAFIVGAFIL